MHRDGGVEAIGPTETGKLPSEDRVIDVLGMGELFNDPEAIKRDLGPKFMQAMRDGYTDTINEH